MGAVPCSGGIPSGTRLPHWATGSRHRCVGTAAARRRHVSEIFEMTASRERLRLLRDVADAERRRVQADPRAAALFGVLATRIQQRLDGGAQEAAGTLATRTLFDGSNTCRQRHYFYYD